MNVPTNSILTIHGQTVMVHPINDGFSERDPYHRRSSAFAQTKGLTTNEKAAARAASPVATPAGDLENHRLFPTSFIPTSAGRNRTPDPGPLRSRAATTQLSIVHPTSGLANNRPLSPPPDRPETAAAKSPSQGNIKKKRRSLNIGEHAHPAEYADGEPQRPESPVMGQSRGSELGTSEKAARVLGIGS